MTVEQVRAALRARPFRPFILRMADNHEYRVDHPELALPTPGGRTSRGRDPGHPPPPGFHSGLVISWGFFVTGRRSIGRPSALTFEGVTSGARGPSGFESQPTGTAKARARPKRCVLGLMGPVLPVRLGAEGRARLNRNRPTRPRPRRGCSGRDRRSGRSSS